ncbi:MAG: YaaR family protein [Spirochaetaceae bacterium]|jgi:uncharacterized protein YaaR (DUF327 family)|nr:YaaR family protein [Spirochaetaceae bacterium]
MASVEGAVTGLYHNFQLNALQADAAKAGKKDKTEKTEKGLFAGLLKKAVQTEGTDAETAAISARLENLSRDEAAGLLLEDVRTAGSALKDRPLPDEILRYKKSVRAFMHFVVKNSFDVEVSVNRIKQKKSVQIVVVDHKLERLAAEILSGQLSQLTLLSRVEEINGLLVDMLK